MTALRALAFLTLVACVRAPTGPGRSSPCWTVTVCIDESFSEKQRASIIHGVDSWDHALGDGTMAVSFRLVTAAYAERLPVVGEVHYLRVSSITNCRRQDNITVVGCTSGGVARLSDETSESNRMKVAAHEFGHLAGIHRHVSNTVMAEMTDESAERPTQRDVAAFCTIHCHH